MQRPRPIEVKPLENYLLLISFSNGEDKIFDVKPMISGSWFGELQEKGIFNTVKISVSVQGSTDSLKGFIQTEHLLYCYSFIQ